jgi:nicotinamide phosphoribosyltransferase
MKGGLVIRPDSGDPVQVTERVIEILGEKFGYTTNEKGYKVLNPKVRIIQGDGINLKMIEKILYNFMLNGWSADNIAFGMGGALLQQVNRDSLKFAMKTNEVIREGVAIDVFKDPATDHGKASKKGRQIVVKNAFGELEGWAEHDVTKEFAESNELEVRYKDGDWFRLRAFNDIRVLAEID